MYPHVAIIIPTFNEEYFIEQCLYSVLHQTYPIALMDILVVDGGSTDNTCMLVHQLALEYTNIKLLHNIQKIQSVAFNIGVQHSTAPYIIRLDAHASYNTDYIERCIQTFGFSETALGCKPEELGNVGGRLDIQPSCKGTIPEAIALLNKVQFGCGGAAFRTGVQSGLVDTVPFGCFPRTVIEQVGEMRADLARGEDNEYNTRIRKAGYKIYLNADVQCTYYARRTVMKNLQQMYANGCSIGKLVHIDYHAISIRHLVPVGFTAFLLLTAMSGCIYPPLWLLFTFGLGIYLIADIIASLDTCRKFGWRYIAILPLLFFLVHISYGVGTIAGFLRK